MVITASTRNRVCPRKAPWVRILIPLPSIIDNLDIVAKKPATAGFFGALSIVSKYAAAVDFLGRFRCLA